MAAIVGVPKLDPLLAAVREGEEVQTGLGGGGVRRLADYLERRSKGQAKSFPLDVEHKEWVVALLPLLLHPDQAVRNQALVVLRDAHQHKPLTNGPPKDLFDVKGIDAVKEMLSNMEKELVESKNIAILDYLDVIIQLLGKNLHSNIELVNCLLIVTRAAFTMKHNTPIIDRGYRTWGVLMENFALSPDVIGSSKRVKMLLRALAHNNGKEESTLRAKLHCWWKLMVLLGPKLPHHSLDVVQGFLSYCYGPKADRNDSVTEAKNLSLLCSPISPVRKYNGLEKLCLEALVELVGSRPLPSHLPRSELQPGLNDAAVTPAQLGEMAPIIFTAVVEASSVLKPTNLTHKLNLRVVWEGVTSLLHQLTDLPDHGTAVQLYLKAVKQVFLEHKRQEKLHSFLLFLLQQTLSLPPRVLLSPTFQDGASEPQVSPLLLVFSLLLHPDLVHGGDEFKEFLKVVSSGAELLAGPPQLGDLVHRLEMTAQQLTPAGLDVICSVWRTISRSVTNWADLGESRGGTLNFHSALQYLRFPLQYLSDKDLDVKFWKDWEGLYSNIAAQDELVVGHGSGQICSDMTERAVSIFKSKPEPYPSNFLVAQANAVHIMVGKLLATSLARQMKNSSANNPLAGFKRQLAPLGLATSTVVHLNSLLEAAVKRGGRTVGEVWRLLIESYTTLYTQLQLPELIRPLLRLTMSSLASLYTTATLQHLDLCGLSLAADRLFTLVVSVLENKYKGLRDKELLEDCEDFFVNCFECNRKTRKMNEMWHVTFGSLSKEEIPNKLARTLRTLTSSTLISKQMGVEKDAGESNSFPSSSEAIAPVAEPAIEAALKMGKSTTPRKVSASTTPRKTVTGAASSPSPAVVNSPKMKPPVLTPKRASVGRPSRQTKPLDEEDSQDFVVIAKNSKGKRSLTEHQKDKMTSRHDDIPALYSELSRDDSIIQLPSQFVSQSSVDESNSAIDMQLKNPDSNADKTIDDEKAAASTDVSSVPLANGEKGDEAAVIENETENDISSPSQSLLSKAKAEEMKKRKNSRFNPTKTSPRSATRSNVIIASPSKSTNSSSPPSAKSAANESPAAKTDSTQSPAAKSTVIVSTAVTADLSAAKSAATASTAVTADLSAGSRSGRKRKAASPAKRPSEAASGKRSRKSVSKEIFGEVKENDGKSNGDSAVKEADDALEAEMESKDAESEMAPVSLIEDAPGLEIKIQRMSPRKIGKTLEAEVLKATTPLRNFINSRREDKLQQDGEEDENEVIESSQTTHPVSSRPKRERRSAPKRIETHFTEDGDQDKKASKSKNVFQIGKRNAFGETLLHQAAKKADVEKVKEQLDIGADPNVSDAAGWCPLHEVVASTKANSFSVLEILVEHGSVVDCRGPEGETPLQEAVAWKKEEMVRYLLSAGADPDLKNQQGESARSMARGIPHILAIFEPEPEPQLLDNREQVEDTEDLSEAAETICQLYNPCTEAETTGRASAEDCDISMDTSPSPVDPPATVEAVTEGPAPVDVPEPKQLTTITDNPVLANTNVSTSVLAGQEAVSSGQTEEAANSTKAEEVPTGDKTDEATTIAATSTDEESTGLSPEANKENQSSRPNVVMMIGPFPDNNSAPANTSTLVINSSKKSASSVTVKRMSLNSSSSSGTSRGAMLLNLSRRKSFDSRDVCSMPPILSSPGPASLTPTTTTSSANPPWLKYNPSPSHASPSASILKRKTTDDLNSSSEGSPLSTKRRHVHFNDNPVTDSVEIPRMQEKHTRKKLQMISFDTELTTPSLKKDSQDSEESCDIYKESPPMDVSTNAIFPELVKCEVPVSEIIHLLSCSITFTKILEKDLKEENITTIGDLASLEPSVVRNIKGIKPICTVTVKTVLKAFMQRLKRDGRMEEVSGRKKSRAPVEEITTQEEEEKIKEALFHGPSPSPTDLKLCNLSPVKPPEEENSEKQQIEEKKLQKEDKETKGEELQKELAYTVDAAQNQADASVSSDAAVDDQSADIHNTDDDMIGSEDEVADVAQVDQTQAPAVGKLHQADDDDENHGVESTDVSAADKTKGNATTPREGATKNAAASSAVSAASTTADQKKAAVAHRRNRKELLNKLEAVIQRQTTLAVQQEKMAAEQKELAAVMQTILNALKQL